MKGKIQRSNPYFPALAPATRINIVNKVSWALGLATPEKRKAKFITTPKKAAVVVKHPKINPSPTKTSPHGTNTLKRPILGSATPSKKDAHQLSTPGFFMAPWRKPEASNPPALTLSHP